MCCRRVTRRRQLDTDSQLPHSSPSRHLTMTRHKEVRYLACQQAGFFPQIMSTVIFFHYLDVPTSDILRNVIGYTIAWSVPFVSAISFGYYLMDHRSFPSLENRKIIGMTGYIISMLVMKWALWKIYVDKDLCLGTLITAVIFAQFFISSFVLEACRKGAPEYNDYWRIILFLVALTYASTSYEIIFYVSETFFFSFSKYFAVSPSFRVTYHSNMSCFQEKKGWIKSANEFFKPNEVVPQVLLTCVIGAFVLDLYIVLREKMSRRRYVWIGDKDKKNFVISL